MNNPSETPPANSPSGRPQRRRHRRIGTCMDGRIVFAGVDAECIVHEMSASGALVEVRPLPALGAEVALDVPGVAFAKGKAVRHVPGGVCVELDLSPARRDRVSDRLILAAFRFPPDK